MVKFDPKDPEEFFPLIFEFGPELDGQTIQSAAVSVTVHSGEDADPSAILSGAATISGDRVRQNVVAGASGVEYLIRVTVTAANGFKYTLGRVLPVKLAGTY